MILGLHGLIVSPNRPLPMLLETVVLGHNGENLGEGP
jgi:hypothetical protein